MITSIISQNLKNKAALPYKDKIFEHNLKLTKAFIKNHKEKIFFTKADKGNVTVCMKVDEYKEKMKLLLNDRHTYKIEKRNPLISLQNEVKKILIELNNIDALEKKYNNPLYELSPTHTMLPKGYGLPKSINTISL